MLLPKNTLKRENPGKYLSFPVSKEVARAGPGSLCCEAGLLPGTPSGPPSAARQGEGSATGQRLGWAMAAISNILLLVKPCPAASPGRAGSARPQSIPGPGWLG